MAYEVLLAPAVVQRVDEVADYIAGELDSPRAASDFLDGIDGLVRKLERNPLAYPLVHDARLQARGYRRALVGNYVVLFLVRAPGEGEGAVWVTNLFHGSQNYQALV
jgi:plasmid stabilization system protein ParE